MEKGTDWRQFRKSTHLASPDLDALKSKGHNLIFTIDRAVYEVGVNVSGTKMDGIFVYFTEPNIKPLKLNSTNMKTIAGFCRANGFSREQANIIENWSGMTIELYVDPNVKMMGKIVDGVRIRPVQPKTIEKKPFTQEMFEKAKQAGATVQSISEHYVITEEVAKMYNEFLNSK